MLLATILCGDVQTFTDKNFTLSEKPTMVKFYAPWCGHCKALAPKYEELATLMGDSAVLAEVDCTVEKEVCGKYKVQGFPTVILFFDSKVYKYDGEREVSDMKLFIESMQVDLLQFKDEATFLEEFKNSKKTSYYTFTVPEKDLQTYENALSELKGKVFINCVKGQQLKLVANRDGKLIQFKKEFTAENILSFIRRNGIPLFTDLSPQNFGTYIRGGIAIFLYGKKEDIKPLYDEFVQLSKTENLEYNPGFLPADDISKDFVVQFNATVDEPALLMIDFVEGDMKKYAFKGFTNESNLVESIKQFQAQIAVEKATEAATPKPKPTEPSKT